MNNNIIVFLPSGEIFNCTSSDKYNLFVLSFAKYKKFINNILIEEYISRDDLKEDIFKIIKDNFKIGFNVVRNGERGYIQGVMDDGWIINFNDKKEFVTNNMLIKNLEYKFINEN